MDCCRPWHNRDSLTYWRHPQSLLSNPVPPFSSAAPLFSRAAAVQMQHWWLEGRLQLLQESGRQPEGCNRTVDSCPVQLGCQTDLLVGPSPTGPRGVTHPSMAPRPAVFPSLLCRIWQRGLGLVVSPPLMRHHHSGVGPSPTVGLWGLCFPCRQWAGPRSMADLPRSPSRQCLLAVGPGCSALAPLQHQQCHSGVGPSLEVSPRRKVGPSPWVGPPHWGHSHSVVGLSLTAAPHLVALLRQPMVRFS